MAPQDDLDSLVADRSGAATASAGAELASGPAATAHGQPEVSCANVAQRGDSKTLEQRQKEHVEYLQRIQAAARAKEAEKGEADKHAMRRRHLLREQILNRQSSCPPAARNAKATTLATSISDPGGEAEGGGGPSAADTCGVAQAAADAIANGPRRALAAVAATRYGGAPTVADYLIWRKRLRIPDGTKVFCMAGSGRHSDDTRQGLLRRGWLENPDGNSPFFDLKWAVRSVDIDHASLLPGQIVNHFVMGMRLTTKVGLMYCLRETSWFVNADCNSFFPRSYDLSQAGDRQSFLKDMRLTAAISLLKRAQASGSTAAVGAGAFAAALQAVRHHLRQLSYLRAECSRDGSCVAGGPKADAGLDDATWRSITGHALLQSQPPAICPVYTPDDTQTFLTRDVRFTHGAVKSSAASTGQRRAQTRKSRKTRESSCDALKSPGALPSGLKALTEQLQRSSDIVSQLTRTKELLELQRSEAAGTQARASSDDLDEGTWASCNSPCASPHEMMADGSVAGAVQDGSDPVASATADVAGSLDMEQECVRERSGLSATRSEPQADGVDDEGTLDVACRLLTELRQLHPQLHMEGMSNLWIVKPAGKSRGRGIRIFNDMDTLLDYVKQAKGDKDRSEHQWVVQKYIERPLIVHRRKFDIRQWVLVTSWNPLVAWFYKDCYLRFAADFYDTTNHNVHSHLCNNSISKYSRSRVPDDITACGNMWTVASFRSWLLSEFGTDRMWSERIEPGMKHAVVCSLISSQQSVKQRDATCQIYGFDFLVDENFQVWLLEVNSSPTMEHSTAITQKLCAAVQEDTLKVIVDLPQTVAKRAASDVDAEPTGAWERILSIPEVVYPLFTGVSLLLEGRCIYKPARPQLACPVPRVYDSHVQRQARLRAAQAEAEAARRAALECSDLDEGAERGADGNELGASQRSLEARSSSSAATTPDGRAELPTLYSSRSSAAGYATIRLPGPEARTPVSNESMRRGTLSGLDDRASAACEAGLSASGGLVVVGSSGGGQQSLPGSGSGRRAQSGASSDRAVGAPALAAALPQLPASKGRDVAGVAACGQSSPAKVPRAVLDRKSTAAEMSWYQRRERKLSKPDGVSDVRQLKAVPMKILSLNTLDLMC